MNFTCFIEFIIQKYYQLKCPSDFSEWTHNYLFHLLIPLFKKIESETSGSTVKHLSAKAINNISIPIPPLLEQQRIVSILDNFEALVNEELPAEITARRKQYEYYREKLLTFEPLIS